jgi:hypothetical protein
MKSNNIIFGLTVLAILSSCGVPQADYDKQNLKMSNSKMRLMNLSLALKN